MEQQRLQQLIDKVLKGQATAKERQELDEWYAAQDESEGLTAGLNSEQKNTMGRNMFDSIHHRIQTEPKPVQINYRKWLMAAAVLFLIAAGAFYFLIKQPVTTTTLASVWKEERTTSEIRNIRLPDGSSVWLNAGSHVRYDSNFVSGKREIFLQGEAFFDVTHMEGKLFQVHTGKVTTTVLGTAFNIDAYTPEEGISVFVKRGKVSVADSAANTMGVLLPDQRLVYKADGTFDRYDSANANYAAWTSGQLEFHDMPFGEVAERLARRFGVTLTFKDSNIGQCRITATFNANTPVNDIIDMLAITNGSTITSNKAGNYIISGKKQCK